MHTLLLALSLSLQAAPLPDDAIVEQETAAWHAERKKRLASEEGWLSVVGLFWLEEGAHSAGSAKESALVFPASAPAKLGTFVREGTAVRFQPEPGVPVQLGGKPFTGGALKADLPGPPDVLALGGLRFFVIQRGPKVGIRLKDADSPARKAFTDIPRFPGKQAWRVEATLVPWKEPTTIPVPNVLGMVEPMPSPGKLTFTVGGKPYELTPVEEKPGALFIIFSDPTNRQETYGSGRFLDAPGPVNGKVVLDFNRATNPPCAFTQYATCPLPPKGNRLSVRVEAGEKRYGSH